jgi:hypothetical protein
MDINPTATHHVSRLPVHPTEWSEFQEPYDAVINTFAKSKWVKVGVATTTCAMY